MRVDRAIFGEVEFRAVPNDDGSTVVHGTAVPWERLSVVLWSDHRTGKPVRERFERGAFKAVLADPALDVVAVRDHNESRLLARTASGTLRVRETSAGLEYDFDSPDTTEGRDLLVQIGRGDIRGSSFAFATNDDSIEWSEEDGVIVRSVQEVSLLADVSPVVRPAYPDSSVAMRSVEAMQSQLEAWRRGVPANEWREQYDLGMARLIAADL